MTAQANKASLTPNSTVQISQNANKAIGGKMVSLIMADFYFVF